MGFNRVLKTIAVLMLLIGMAGVQSAKASDQGYNTDEQKKEKIVQENMKMARRLEDVAAPVLTAKASSCGEFVAPYIGADYVTKDAVSKEYQGVMERLYGAGQYPTVTIIGKGTPAASALKLGDQITHVNGEALPQGKSSLGELRGKIAANKSLKPMTLSIIRAGQNAKVQIQPLKGCATSVLLAPEKTPKAWVSENTIWISKGMLQNTSNDAELSRIIERELSKI